jgi:hypothetical protein
MDEKEKLWNQAVVSVYFWADDRASMLPPPNELIPSMNEALGVLAGETDVEAREAQRLAYAEAARVYPRLNSTAKQALLVLGQKLHLPALTDADATLSEEARVLAVLSAMGGRTVTLYRVRKL